MIRLDTPGPRFQRWLNNSVPARRLIAFGAAGTLAWSSILAGAVVHAEGFDALSGASVGFLVQVAGRQMLVLAAVLALVFAIERVRRGGLWLSRVVFGLGAALPCWEQALFLTAGDSISAHPRVAMIRVCIAAALWVAVVGTFLWLRQALIPAWRPSWRRVAWHLFGWCALLVGLRIVSREVAAYAYLGAHATFLLAAVCGGLVARLAARRRVLGVVVGVFAVATVFSAWQVRAADNSDSVPNASLAELAQATLGPHGKQPTAQLDFSNSARFACRPADLTREGADLELSPSKRRNVLLISVDTLRDDMLHLSVGGRPVMPALSRFASQSIEFSNAFSPYPATIYALGAALSGYSPSELLLAPSIPPSIFREVGDKFDRVHLFVPAHGWFRTAAIEKLLVQGVAKTRATGARQQTSQVISHLEAARAASQTSLTWVHYFEPHAPYERNEGFDFGDDARSRYLSEVAFVDSEIGRLFEFLERDRWLEDTLVLVFADHGESLGEGDYWGHHVHLRKAITDVPMVLRYPGGTPRRVTSVVELADIAATVLEFAGLDGPRTQGVKSLFETLEQPERRVSISEAFPVRGGQLMSMAARTMKSGTIDDLNDRLTQIYELGAQNYDPKVSIVDGQHRLIVNRRTGARELYDQTTNESRTVHRERPEVVAELEQELADWHARQSEAVYCRWFSRSR